VSGRTISATAVISAADKTGNVLDKIASKFKGLEKNAKALEGIKAPKFAGDLFEELKRLKLSEKELQGVRKEMALFQNQLKSSPVRAAHYFRAIDDWQSKQVNKWRELKAGVDETDKAHRKFFASAGRFGLAAAGIGGAAYAVGRIATAGVRANAIEKRESARDYLAGMSDAESQRIKDEALLVSGRYHSVDASTMHERLRDTAMGMRSTEKALELSETIAQGTTVLQSLKGKDQAIEEGRKFFSALDVLGKNIDPKEVKELFDGYIKALGVEGADMNLGGVFGMAKRLKAAGATVSNRFLMTTGVGLGRDMGDERAGNAISMMMQQEVQATKQAKEYGKKYGLRDENGKFADRSEMMRDPDLWAWRRVTAAMERAKLDPNKAEDVNTFLQSAYSNSSARDVISKMMTQREQYQGKAEQFNKAPGLAGAAGLAGKDPFVAYEGLLAQLRNLATLAPGMDSAAAGLNSLSTAVANMNNAIATGTIEGDYKGARWLKGHRESGLLASVSATNDRANLESLRMRQREVAEKLRQGGYSDSVTRDLRMKDFELRSGIDAANNYGSMPPIFSQEELDRWQEMDREHRRGAAYSTFGKGGGGVALPSSDPRKSSEMPPVQSLEGANVQAQLTGSAEVHGEVKQTIEVKASQYFEALVQNAQNAIKLAGQYVANGVGSTGKSSPDAAAPATPHVGSAGNSPL
jgi:hypothetical protein